MGIFSWLFPQPQVPEYLDPFVWQHLIAVSVIGIFFLILAVIMLHPKVPLPFGPKFRFVCMIGFIIVGVTFLMEMV
jgi:hypothetical protein